MRRVMVFGAFDGFHPGHLNFFKQARKHGDYLIVVVARDQRVKKIKGHLPRKREKERLRMIAEEKLVDLALLGQKKNPYQVIKKFKPDVICLGYDQKILTRGLPRFLKETGLKTKIYRMKPYKEKVYHSSIINNN